MTQLRLVAAFAGCLPLLACSDYATFVTATDIGINADVNTQTVSIGYSRTELFTGPAYPERGEAPRAVGFIDSDLHVFSPHIKQVYATGDAAELVTFPTKPPLPARPAIDPPPPYQGERRPMVFATGANVGVKLGFTAGAPAPTSIRFGYNREEISVIPMRREAPDGITPERYAPVIASIDMNLGGNTPAGTKLGIRQFFATGSAARNLAMNDEIRGYFKLQAADAVAQATLAAWERTLDDDKQKIMAFLQREGAFTANRDSLLRATGRYGEMPAELRNAANIGEFLAALDRFFLLKHPLAEIAGG
jgi:hypothetical protein